MAPKGPERTESMVPGSVFGEEGRILREREREREFFFEF